MTVVTPPSSTLEGRGPLTGRGWQPCRPFSKPSRDPPCVPGSSIECRTWKGHCRCLAPFLHLTEKAEPGRALMICPRSHIGPCEGVNKNPSLLIVITAPPEAREDHCRTHPGDAASSFDTWRSEFVSTIKTDTQSASQA